MSVPGFTEDSRSAVLAQWLAMPQLMMSADISRATRLILSLAVSDLEDLMRDCVAGSGRAAMRSSRSLLEHWINMNTVLASPEDELRYLRHLDLGDVQYASSHYAHAFLDKRRRSMVEHDQKVVRSTAESRWATTLNDYGKRYQSAWTIKSLRQRAHDQGIEHVYSAYAMASNIAHGSAAGARGQVFVSAQDDATFYLGPSAQYIPLALIAGVDAYLGILISVENAHPELVNFADARGMLNGFLTDHYRPLWDLAWKMQNAKTTATTDLASNPTCYLAFSRRGRIRWYVHMRQLGSDRWYWAYETSDLTRIAEAFQGLIQFYADTYDNYGDGGWVALELPGLTAGPNISKPSIPSSAIFPRLVVREPGSIYSGWRIATDLASDGSLEFSDWSIVPGDFDLDLDALIDSLGQRD